MDVGELLALFNPLFTHNWTINRPQQMSLVQAWRDRLAEGKALPSFQDAGFRAFSQSDEDGILLLLFAVLGTTNKKSVEVCCGDGIECNSANLIVNHGWEALMVDGDENLLAHARSFHEKARDSAHWPPKIRNAWVTAENINELLAADGFTGEIDLFSLDLDGVDYWVWKALEVATPRVVVVEYNDILGPDATLAAPYDPQFKATWEDNTALNYGASLPAFVKLGREKGYRLVGCNALNFNAFFLRNDIGAEIFPEVSVNDCFSHPRVDHNRALYGDRVKTFDWVEV